MHPWRRLLYRLGRWYTNGDWGPLSKSPLDAGTLQGHWWVQKASFHTCRSPMPPSECSQWLTLLIHLNLPVSQLQAKGEEPLRALYAIKSFIDLGQQVYICARAQSIRQRVDAGQLNVPPQQWPITLSLTKVMLDWTPDKLAHNASSQSKLWEARQAIPGFK